MSDFVMPASVAEIRHELAAATQRLLGDTIEVTDEQWAQATELDGWTRAHVATHLARNAEALTRVVNNVVKGTDDPMYVSAAARDADIDAGSGRSGLDLQVDLDTSASSFEEALDCVQADQWGQPVQLRNQTVRLERVPLLRLKEVVLHHVDLNIGFRAGDIPEAVAEWLLDSAVDRIAGRDDFPALDLVSLTGREWQIGDIADSTEIRGTAGDLLCRITGRASDTEGGETLTLPAFG